MHTQTINIYLLPERNTFVLMHKFNNVNCMLLPVTLVLNYEDLCYLKRNLTHFNGIIFDEVKSKADKYNNNSNLTNNYNHLKNDFSKD